MPRPDALTHDLAHGPADEALLDWLTDVATAVDPVPDSVAALARAAFAATRQPPWQPTAAEVRS